jgi:glycosyl transferase family 87
MPLFTSPSKPNIGSTLLACIAFLALSSLWLLVAVRFSETGWDFTQFYIAAHLPIRSLYDHAEFAAMGRKLLAPIGIYYYPPLVRPAFFALALKPLAFFSYWHAYWLWAAAGFVAYLATLLIIFRWLALPKNLLPAFSLFSPSLFGIVSGQDANVYLFVMAAALLLIVSGREIAGGLVLALCAYKFNLLLFLPFVLLFKARWKSIFAFAIGTAVAALLSALLAPPSQYLALLRSIPQLTIGFIPGGLRGVSIRAGHELLYVPLALLGSVFCIYLIWKLPLIEAFCVAVTSALLLGYHVTWYDFALLVLPICVAWRSASSQMRAALLALLVLPFLWILGKEVFQVVAESIVLFPFARMVFASRSQLSS